MNEPPKKDRLDLDNLVSEDLRRQQEFRHIAMPFSEYLRMLEDDSLIAQNSAARILEIVKLGGAELIPKSEKFTTAEKRYKLFSANLFGIERSVEQVVEHFKASASSLSTGKQILLLVGPTASGKSTFVSTVKRALENYRARPVFRIQGCPMNEEPLHLVPPGPTRDKLSKQLGIKIKGDLCPICRYNLKTKYRKDDGVHWEQVLVENFKFSIQAGQGIGSFEPSDKKTSDVSQLVGRENIAITSTKGYDDPRSYELKAGEIFKANRGVLELREMIKSPEEMMWTFISVAEEQEVKVQGSAFPHIGVDVVIIGHTNLTEYKKFSGRQENEALHDRIYVIYFPYPLRIADEVKIYRKLIESESDFLTLKNCHIAPGALELAATFAIMTRLTKPGADSVDLLTKAKIYNGDAALTKLRNRDQKTIDIYQLIEEGQKDPDIEKREGMFGMSSRDVLAAINNALVKYGENSCLTPLRVIQALREVFDHRTGYHSEDVERYKEMLTASEKDSVMVEYKDYIREAVTRAFLRAYSDLAKNLFNRYIEEAEFYRDQKRKYAPGRLPELRRDLVTGRPKEPDLKLMRSIEEQLGIDEREAETFRSEMLELKGSIKDREFTYGNQSYPVLDEAIEKKLIADNAANLTSVLDTNKAKSQEESRRCQDLFDSLTSTGFCPVCAREAVEQAREILTS